MKFVGAALIAAVMMSSCLLPSLHSIYTEESREIDDRIIGTWETERNVGKHYYEQSSQSSAYSKYDDVTFNIGQLDSNFTNATKNLDGDELEQYYFEYAAKVSNFNKSIWTFERAADITFDLNIPGSINDVIYSIELGSESMAPPGSKVIKKHEYPFYLLTYK